MWERIYVGAGMVLYDELGAHKGLRRHRHLTRRKALKIAPALAPDSLVGAVQYYDCQVDDARHTLAVARTAARFGAAVANSISVIGFVREAGRVAGVRVRDHRTSTEFEIRSQVVINATGVWTDELQHLLGERGKFHVTCLQGHPPGRAPGPPAARRGTDPPDRAERPVRDPVGEALADRDHRHRVETDDVLARRTRISIESWDRGAAAAAPVARLMAEVLGWSEEQIAAEIEIYRARVAAERDSQRQDDDRTADAARLTAPDALAGAQGEGAVHRAD